MNVKPIELIENRNTRNLSNTLLSEKRIDIYYKTPDIKKLNECMLVYSGNV